MSDGPHYPVAPGLRSPLMRVFVRAWSRGRRDKQLVVSTYITATAAGEEPSLREIARQTGVGISQVQRFVHEFTRAIREAQKCETAFGMQRIHWVTAPEEWPCPPPPHAS